MIETIKLKVNNKIKENAETRMAVYISIYIVYCHLENKKTRNKNNRSRDRTILKLENRNSIGLSFCVSMTIY